MKPIYCPVCGTKMTQEGKELVCPCGFAMRLKKSKRVHVKPEEK